MSRFKQIIRKLDRDSLLLPLSRDAVSVGVRRKRVRAITCKRGRVCDAFPCPCKPELSRSCRRRGRAWISLPSSAERVGFTGTQTSLTDEQRRSLAALLERSQAFELHHGDCIGADAAAAVMAFKLGWTVVSHPPTDPSKRAHAPFDEEVPAMPYLDRNKQIVNDTDVLIACPKGPEVLRSGTWSTVRYARSLDRRVFVVWPSGVVERDH